MGSAVDTAVGTAVAVGVKEGDTVENAMGVELDCGEGGRVAAGLIKRDPTPPKMISAAQAQAINSKIRIE